MVTSRSVPQQTAQITSALAGHERLGGRFSHMGQVKPKLSSKGDEGRKPHYATTGKESPLNAGFQAGLPVNPEIS